MCLGGFQKADILCIERFLCTHLVFFPPSIASGHVVCLHCALQEKSGSSIWAAHHWRNLRIEEAANLSLNFIFFLSEGDLAGSAAAILLLTSAWQKHTSHKPGRLSVYTGDGQRFGFPYPHYPAYHIPIHFSNQQANFGTLLHKNASWHES